MTPGNSKTQLVETVLHDIYGSSVPPVTSLTTLQKEAFKLLGGRQFASCEILTTLDLSRAEAEDRSRHIDLHLLAECAFQQGQWVTAKALYCQLFDYDESLYRFKVACCLEKMEYMVEAIYTIDEIPLSQRTEDVHILYAKLHVASSSTQKAIEAFLEALRKNPYAIEAVYALASLNTDTAKILSAIDEGHRKHGGEQENIVKEIALVLCAKVRHQTTTALQKADALAIEYPGNVEIMSLRAELYQQIVDYSTAESIYKDVRSAAPYRTRGMDRYADLLGHFGKISALSELADEMLILDDRSPVAWTCLAIYQKYAFPSQVEQVNKALKFIDKAIALDQRHSFAHFVRGTILLEGHRPEYAAVAFFRSNEIEPAIATFEGLVDAYMEASKNKEAVAAAKQVWSLAPRDPRTLTLTGLALAQCSDAQAKRPLKKALQMSPALARPLFCLVDLYKQEHQYDACLEILNEALSACSDSSGANIAKLEHILCAIGDVHAATEKYNSAFDAYNRALAANPSHGKARESLEQLEKLMKGLDPNENSDDIVEDPVPDGTGSSPSNP